MSQDCYLVERMDNSKVAGHSFVHSLVQWLFIEYLLCARYCAGC